jgi:hypothetical protein
MNNNQILTTWRKHLAEKLQDQYGLHEEDAEMKADLWLRSVKVEPALAAQLHLHGAPQNHETRSGKSRAAAAGGLYV